MDSFQSSYRRAWMIGVNAIVGWQKLMLAQTKWLLPQNRSWAAPSERVGGAEPVARPAATAAQAADERRREPTPRGSTRGDDRRARSRTKRRKRS